MIQPTTGANLGFENKLWNAADRLRRHMDAAEYKHVVLGLIFLKPTKTSFHAPRGMPVRTLQRPSSGV